MAFNKDFESKILAQGRNEFDEPIPPVQHFRYAGYHWLTKIDHDGRSCGTFPFQWNPVDYRWYQCGEISMYGAQPIRASGWKYTCECPVPESEDDLLAQYTKEIHGEHKPLSPFSLGGLINSHRSLREFRRRSEDERKAEFERAREFGEKQGRELVTHGQYVEVAKLLSMTVQELVEFIGVPE